MSEANRSWIISDKLAKGCIDCGYREHPEALDYDHLDESEKWSTGTTHAQRSRTRAISASWSLGRIQAEVLKCEVRCANCHRVKTAERRRAALFA